MDRLSLVFASAGRRHCAFGGDILDLLGRWMVVTAVHHRTSFFVLEKVLCHFLGDL